LSTEWQRGVNGEETGVTLFTSDLHFLIGECFRCVLPADKSHSFVDDFYLFRNKDSNIFIACILTGNEDGGVLEEIMCLGVDIDDELKILFISRRLIFVIFSENLNINCFLSDL
jgi:hypothetical protein